MKLKNDINVSDLQILKGCFNKIKSYINTNRNTRTPVLKYREPSELHEVIDFKIKQQGVNQNEFLELLDKYLDYSVKTANKQFLNQLFSGFNFPAFIGEIFTALTNTSMYTYEVAPVATMIETEMIRLLCSYAGYTDGDGIFAGGGSNANLVAMFSARNRIVPESRFDGCDKTQRLKAFVSDQAHYSFETAANLLGIGSKNVIKIISDEYGRMIPGDLEKKIKESLSRGEKPFFVAATCATTMLGAYDPIEEIARICRMHGIWLHADGSFGGSILLSDTYRCLMKGIEETDSLAWNPHKLMNIPLICSALLVKRRGTLQHNITDINVDYIYHDTSEIEDLGKKSIQCGRRVDAVKLWFAWKYFGLKGYQDRIDNLIHISKYAEEKVNQHPQLELLVSRQSFTICFRYIPGQEADVNAFNLKLREALRKSGKSVVNYGFIGKSLAIRLVAANGALTKNDIDIFFENFLIEANKR